MLFPLAKQWWLNDPKIIRLYEILEKQGEVRFVGGCVRNGLLNKTVYDIDLATNIKPLDTIKILQEIGIKTAAPGLKHGTVLAIIDDITVEITTLRQDIQTDGRHAVVAFTSDWKKDASRRDFTINAIYCDKNGNLYDPFNGLGDLAKGYIRFIGNAQDRISEDNLRLLRYFRFYAYYGKIEPTQKILNILHDNSYKLNTLSGERIRIELEKLLAAPDPFSSINLMHTTTVLSYIILSDNIDFTLFKNLIDLENWLKKNVSISIPFNWLRRLYILNNQNKKTLFILCNKLKLSNKERIYIRNICKNLFISPKLSKNQLKSLIYKIGKILIIDFLLLNWAKEFNNNEFHLRQKDWIELLNFICNEKIPIFPLKGSDLLSLGVKPGPQLGKIFKETETWWLDHGLTGNKLSCLNYVKNILKS
ncbi:MAG: CCA tRNA nucleotidyltransferase [Alphaproteobacteria bacterium]|nr:CCA tRNA nucleotidyltransferase [Alphaproteobacteria bacterium]